MPINRKETLYLREEYWNCTVDELKEELKSFVDEFKSYTPDWFAEVKFHLLRHSGLTLETRDDFCAVSIESKQCKQCDDLYLAKQCLLWYRLFDIIRWDIVSRAPPCIRISYKNKSIKTVANFLKKANLVSPPFYKARAPPRCGNMSKWGHCKPDEYCRAMQTDNLLEYNKARERVKTTRST
ncbi:MAG: hypothetical protein P1Q69_12960 [Candidatus Thorarchaeota archaeon]|nr:hypothetical protein [Candidatus Thorarchaeota archaeon]